MTWVVSFSILGPFRAGPRLGKRPVAVGISWKVSLRVDLPGGHRPAALRRERLDQKQSEEFEGDGPTRGLVVGRSRCLKRYTTKVVSFGGFIRSKAGVAGPSRAGVVLSR